MPFKENRQQNKTNKTMNNNLKLQQLQFIEASYVTGPVLGVLPDKAHLPIMMTLQSNFYYIHFV